MTRVLCSSVIGAAAIAAPSTLRAADTLSVFASADLLVQGLVLALGAASLAGIAVAVAKLAPGRKLTGGSAFLSALRWAGPLAGLFGAGYGALTLFMGLADAGVTPPLAVLAPALAESALVFLVGVVAGVVGAVGAGLVEARIDRTVLGA